MFRNLRPSAARRIVHGAAYMVTAESSTHSPLPLLSPTIPISSLSGAASPPPPARTLALTKENRRELAALASSTSLGKMPKPPPGYKQNRTKGFPLADFDTLFGHVLNALGPEIATAKNQPPPESGDADRGEAVGSKRARSPVADEGGGKRSNANGSSKSGGGSSEHGRSPMDVDSVGGSKDSKPKTKQPGGAAAKSEAKPEPAPPSDPVQEGLQASKKAFSRVLGVWEGVAMEGKRGLHQRVVARLGRILAEAEAAAALAQGTEASKSEVGPSGVILDCTPTAARVFCGRLTSGSVFFALLGVRKTLSLPRHILHSVGTQSRLKECTIA